MMICLWVLNAISGASERDAKKTELSGTIASMTISPENPIIVNMAYTLGGGSNHRRGSCAPFYGILFFPKKSPSCFPPEAWRSTPVYFAFSRPVMTGPCGKLNPTV